MDYRSSLFLSALVILLFKVFQKLLNTRQRRLPFPPGPSPKVLVGNFYDLPAEQPWLTYTKWGRQYGVYCDNGGKNDPLTVIKGDLVHASAFGQHIVVVNSAKVANELFKKRSHIYSDRPVVPVVELMGWDFNVGMMPIGDKWRQHRRMFQQHFRRDIALDHRPAQMKKVHQFLQGLLADPRDFRELIKTLAAATIMSTVYGYDVKPSNDRFVALSENAVQKISNAFLPGAAVVNAFPILRFLPSWMPGADFQRFAAECRQSTKEMQKVPFDFVKQNMLNGVNTKSVVAKLLEACRARGYPDDGNIPQMAAAAYAAGADTTASTLASFFLAMALNPDIQSKAQGEIEAIVGPHRLPKFEDRPSLPYVEALYREVMRWRPVVPLGVAHATSTSDVYNGYFIPKGATVISNIWAMTRDECIYPEPERFNPDRFFTADGKLNDDDTVLAFGFGQRICLGRHYAEATVWGTIVTVLSTFSIAKAKDANGNEIDIDPKYTDGLASHPEPFLCSVIPLSETAKNLVQATAEVHKF
ncbi:O-methylsterigmatocystin oxidoreductase [Mycena venus]|uniref:O-methylsterigmatocystin oxidoreductase n=1 Tax=Mycena venus TaxID=2733690 RepID=A0A8H6YTX7_9AGAR|nr:O-methylsterigmatocystin oxidoreductase [Mycena venus]